MDMNSFLAEKVEVEHALRELMRTEPTDDQLVEFFRKPGPFRHFGNEGDCMGWTARETAQHALDSSSPVNGLTPAQAELLALLSEELSEAGQVIGKILRHGYESHHPDTPGVTNRDLLTRELGDVNAAVNLLCKAQELDAGRILNCTNLKLARVGQYLHHN